MNFQWRKRTDRRKNTKDFKNIEACQTVCHFGSVRKVSNSNIGEKRKDNILGRGIIMHIPSVSVMVLQGSIINRIYPIGYYILVYILIHTSIIRLITSNWLVSLWRLRSPASFHLEIKESK